MELMVMCSRLYDCLEGKSASAIACWMNTGETVVDPKMLQAQRSD